MPPDGCWAPHDLRALAERVHDHVPHGCAGALDRAHEAPRYPHLDGGASAALWKHSVRFDDTAIRVFLAPRNRELVTLGSTGVAWIGTVVFGTGLVGLLSILTELGSSPAAQFGATTAAIGVGTRLPFETVALSAAFGFALVFGALGVLGGAYALWRAQRSSFLSIGMHGIRLDRLQISYDEILGVHSENGSLRFDLLDGSELVTPSGMLEAPVADSLCEEVIRRLPSEGERAAGFVAFERARWALGLRL